MHWLVNKAKAGLIHSRVLYNFVKAGSIELLLFINLCYI